MKNKTNFDGPFNWGIKKEKEYFLENLSMLVSSGMTLVASLEIIKKEIKTPRMVKIMNYLISEIDEGMPLWKTLEKTNLFPKTLVYLIKTGEQGGKLTENLNIIVENQQKERLLKSKIYSAMTYPILVISLTIIVGLGIVWFILPNLATVFSQMNIELPLITQILIGVGKFLGKWGHIFIPALLGFLFLVYYFLFIRKQTRYLGQSLIFKIPGIKKLIREIELARFGYTMGSLLHSGFLVVEALNSLEETTTSIPHKKLYAHLKINIEEGNSFQKSFISNPESKKLIPASVQQMISIGEQSGNLSDTMMRINSIYENKSETTIKNLTTIIEPVLLIIVWVGVMIVALAVILPIYGLIGNFGQY